MCGIFTVFGKYDEKKVKEGFDKTVYRGPDMSRIIKGDDYFIGFHRLAIMGLNEAVCNHLKQAIRFVFVTERYMDLENRRIH